MRNAVHTSVTRPRASTVRRRDSRTSTARQPGPAPNVNTWRRRRVSNAPSTCVCVRVCMRAPPPARPKDPRGFSKQRPPPLFPSLYPSLSPSPLPAGPKNTNG